MSLMAQEKKKKGAEPSKDRHVAKNMIRVSDLIYQQLKLLASENQRPVSWEIRLALIRHLEQHGKWPPP
jgi:hypothetical protein